jgi:Fur family ferric uptake transcriptional regulator
MDRERIREQIRRAGMRATTSRIAVIEKLREVGRPMTHGDLSDELVPKGFDRASIFRNLVDLTQAGLVSRTDLGDHAWRYHAGGEDLPGQESSYTRHPHFVCVECGGVQCLDAVEVTVKAVRKRRAPKAVLRKNVEISFRGYCDACNAMA